MVFLVEVVSHTLIYQEKTIQLNSNHLCIPERQRLYFVLVLHN